jgi:hypothetical protein
MTCLYHMMFLLLIPTWWKMVLLLRCNKYFISTKCLNLTLLSGPISCGITKYFWTEFACVRKHLNYEYCFLIGRHAIYSDWTLPALSWNLLPSTLRQNTEATIFSGTSVLLYQTTRSQDLEDSIFKYVFNCTKICVHVYILPRIP